MDTEHLNKLLAAGVSYGASDIHFKVGSPPSYRVNGALRQLKTSPLTPEATLSICQTLCRNSVPAPIWEELREFDGSYSLPGTARFRVNIYRQRGSLSIILRIIPKAVPTIDSLGLPAAVKELADLERGLVLVTGATGSGKSSTLAAMIDRVNQSRSVHVLTIEDPIEFLHNNGKASVSQREIGVDTENYKVALRSALRQDPDVILVGEMRDQETVDIALKAAETGHMVFSTVHTTDASKTINRLIAMFAAEEQAAIRMRLAEILQGTVSQRLLQRADGKGRALACEIMVATETTKEYIRDPARTSGLKGVLEKGRSTYGMQTFDQHLTELLRAKVITREVALSAASSPADFERAMNFE